MSPVFRHGRLRLYLLRLLAEEPRHGYEVIRQLRDQFMGVYAPSPGTIYPRLARLEEEGLVTHDEVDGRKVYRITEAGRQELRDRADELDELEEELHASVSDIVREVKEDVRETVRNLRERGQSRNAWDEAKRAWQEATKAGDAPWDKLREHAAAFRQAGEEGGDQGPGTHGWHGWTEWSRWTDWPGRKNFPGPHDAAAFRDLERLAREFVGDLRKVAWDSGAIGADVLGNLRGILEDSLERIRTEIFGPDPGDAGDDAATGGGATKDGADRSPGTD